MEDEKSTKNIQSQKSADKNGKNQAPPENEQVTIMPTMIDESEQKIAQKRDLSAIIPKESVNNENGVELISQEKALKSDGAVVVANINAEGEASLSNTPTFPEQIDFEQRKKDNQKNIFGNKKKKKINKKANKLSQRIQNWTAIGALLVIIFLCGFWYWYNNHSTENDFTPLTVTVELGDKLPIRTSSYVKPGVGDTVDELLYVLDLSNVVIDEVGEYEFTVTYNGITKTGMVVIVDTTAPELIVREVTITEGSSFDASTFIDTCNDPSGCNYSFQDAATVSSYTSPGSYVVYVVATDAFGNSTTKKTSLIIESMSNVKKWKKEVPYDFDSGYEIVETYELHFSTYSTHTILVNGTHIIVYKYQDEEVYEKARATYNGEEYYSSDDATMSITMSQTIHTVGSNYSDLSDIEEYLTINGFEEEG